MAARFLISRPSRATLASLLPSLPQSTPPYLVPVQSALHQVGHFLEHLRLHVPPSAACQRWRQLVAALVALHYLEHCKLSPALSPDPAGPNLPVLCPPSPSPTRPNQLTHSTHTRTWLLVAPKTLSKEKGWSFPSSCSLTDTPSGRQATTERGVGRMRQNTRICGNMSDQ